MIEILVSILFLLVPKYFQLAIQSAIQKFDISCVNLTFTSMRLLSSK